MRKLWLDDECQRKSMIVECAKRHPDELTFLSFGGFQFSIDKPQVAKLRDYLTEWLASREDGE